MKKAFYLSTCDTCRSVLDQVDAKRKGILLQDIKSEKITPEQIDEMKELAGSYESLFSRRALKYKSLGLKDRNLTEADYRRLILEEYTFLKRPVIILNKKIFAGNDKKTIEALKKAI